VAELTEQTCEPCEGNDIEPMTMDEARDYLDDVSEWTLESVPKINKSYSFADFVTAIDFVNSIAEIAEDEGHHPNISIDYNTVDITIWTHAIDGLSENDFILAAKFDEVANQYQ
jgi:4a-hydroxytetrahydrobiopterin dehydratase